ncbi:Replication-associated protein [Smittium culicis]|uniref:Replication-associated protein n=1 Tax=Smittium culicis TaxID=133412 RepID=A0A1R1Y2J6_9FUNG|nr:Replication-associated protein [Smittium culicis]
MPSTTRVTHYAKRGRLISASRSTSSPRALAPRPTLESIIASATPVSENSSSEITAIDSQSSDPTSDSSSQPIEIQIRAPNHNVSRFIDDCASVAAPAKKKAYRLASMSFFLTYPKCALSKETVLAELKKICDIETYIVARELHADGTPHIHAYLKVKKTINSKNPRYFDIMGYHGNYESCRYPKNVMKYVMKDKNYITNSTESQSKKSGLDTINKVFACSTVEEAIAVIRSDYNLARDYLRNPIGYEQGLAHILHPPKPVTRNPAHRFRDVPELLNWDRQDKTLWLYGVTGTGKTSFAKTLYTMPLFVTHLEDLKKIKPYHNGIIFDDMNFVTLGFSREEMIKLTDLDDDRSFSVKYTSKTIPAKMSRVFCSNVSIFYDDKAIRRRLKIVLVTTDLRIVDADTDLNYNMDEDAPQHCFTAID